MTGSVEGDLNDLPAAAADYRKALVLVPTQPSALFGLARVLRRRNDTVGAQEIFTRFQKVAAARLGAPLSHTYGEEGRYARAEDAASITAAAAPMIPVTFASAATWKPFAPATSPGAPCILSPSPKGLILAVLGSGDSTIRLLTKVRRSSKLVRICDTLTSPRGLLHGLPLTVKSSVCVAGHRCETGSLANRAHRPVEDAETVARPRHAGAIILGTTNCPEFLMAYETGNLLYGITNNPWDLTRTAGGLSGGESAAIPAGLSAGVSGRTAEALRAFRHTSPASARSNRH